MNKILCLWCIVSGSVMDADTQRPVPAFVVERCLLPNNETPPFSYEPILSGSDGRFALTLNDLPPVRAVDSDRPAYALRVSADGYAPALSAPLALSGTNNPLTFKLKPAAAADLQILTADARPAAGADVTLVRDGGRLSILDRQLNANPTGGSFALRSDAAGRVKIPPQENDRWHLVIIHELGLALAAAADLPTQPPLSLTLQRWSRVEGVSRAGTRPDAASELWLSLGDQRAKTVTWLMTAQPDTAGKFVFASAPAGRLSVGKKISYSRGATTAYSHHFTVQPGDTASVSIGGAGRPVAGRFIIPPELSGSGATFGLAQLLKKSHPAAGPDNYYLAPVSDSGEFQAPDILPGEYLLSVTLQQPSNLSPLAAAAVTISVPPASEPVSDELFTIPPVPLQLSPAGKR